MPLHIRKSGELVEKSTLTAFEQQVVDSFELHIKLMFADEWYVEVKFEPVEEEAMETECNPEYRTAKVSVDSENLKDQPEYVHHYVRHELLHVLTWNFFDIAGTLAYKNAKEALLKLEEAVIGRLEHMPGWERMYKDED